MLPTEDYLAILDVIARANLAADDKDVETTAAHYTPDGQITGSFTARPGAPFRDDLAKMFQGEGTLKRHVPANPVIEGEGDRATVRWVLVVFEGETAPNLVATCLVRDEMRKVGGRWLIAHHDVRIDPSMKANVGQNQG